MSTNVYQPKLTCPHCDKKLQLKQTPPAGAKLRCPGCRNVIMYASNSSRFNSGTYDLAPPELPPLESENQIQFSNSPRRSRPAPVTRTITAAVPRVVSQNDSPSKPWHKDPILRFAMAIPLIAALAMGTYLLWEQSRATFHRTIVELKESADRTQASGNIRDACNMYVRIVDEAQGSTDPKVVEIVRLAEIERDKILPKVKDQLAREEAERKKKDAEQRLAREKADAEQRLARERADAEQRLAQEEAERKQKEAEQRLALSKDPVASFKYLIENEIERFREHNVAKPMVYHVSERNDGGIISPAGWVKCNHILSRPSYDVRKTDSLVSPYTATFHVIVTSQFSRHCGSKQEAEASQEFRHSSADPHEFNYAFQEGNWVIKSSRHYAPILEKWFDLGGKSLLGMF